MFNLPIYEIGVDDNPLEDSNILMFDSHTQFGMFEVQDVKQGQVIYSIPEKYETLSQALNHAGIDLTGNDCDDFGECHKVCIMVDDWDNQLTNGMRWCYEHDYYAALGTIDFPFQNVEYYNLALKQNWCILASEYRETVEYQQSKTRPKSDITFIYHDIVYRGKSIKVTWVEHKQCERKLHDFKVNNTTEISKHA